MSPKEMVRLGHGLAPLVLIGIGAFNRRRYQKNYLKALEAAYESSEQRALYLASIIDRHGIELDEFDIIALYES